MTKVIVTMRVWMHVSRNNSHYTSVVVTSRSSSSVSSTLQAEESRERHGDVVQQCAQVGQQQSRVPSFTEPRVDERRECGPLSARRVADQSSADPSSDSNHSSSHVLHQ